VPVEAALCALVPLAVIDSCELAQFVYDDAPVRVLLPKPELVVKPTVPKSTDAVPMVMHGLAAVTVAAIVPLPAVNAGKAERRK
jgi:hypothetical protein